jgi:hypothetical protein
MWNGELWPDLSNLRVDDVGRRACDIHRTVRFADDDRAAPYIRGPAISFDTYEPIFLRDHRVRSLTAWRDILHPWRKSNRRAVPE